MPSDTPTARHTASPEALGWRVERMAGALGAVIHGVDLARPLSAAELGGVRRALLDQQVIFFRDQDLSVERLIELGGSFGSLNIHPFVQGLADYPQVISVVKEPQADWNFGEGWHSDLTFLQQPPLGTLLYALDTPRFGGDTVFANQRLAYDALSGAMRGMLQGLRAVHSAERQYSDAGISVKRNTSGSMTLHASERAAARAVHPVVRVHPETGAKGLFVNPAFTEHFDGMSRAESRPLLEFLYRHSVQEKFSCRFRWRNGSLAFWDNRCVQHNALNDYHGQRREMRRVTIDGDRPK